MSRTEGVRRSVLLVIGVAFVLTGCHQTLHRPAPITHAAQPPHPAPTPLHPRKMIAFRVTEVGTFGGKTSDSFGINDRGEITGTAADASGFGHLYLYKNRRLQDLGRMGQGHSSVGRFINGREQIAGETSDDRTFLWQRGRYRPVRPFYGMDSEINVGISGLSADGTVAGTVDASTFWIGYLWRRGRTRLFNHPPSRETRCDAISPHTYWVLWTGHTFLRARQGPTSFSITPPAGFSTVTANAINDAGEVAGSTSDFLNQKTRPVWGSRTRRLAVLSLPVGFPDGTVEAINASGRLVGQCSDASGKSHALYYVNGKMFDLNDLIDSRGGWVLLDARAINARGQIVGSGIHHGSERGFLLTPVPGAAASGKISPHSW